MKSPVSDLHDESNPDGTLRNLGRGIADQSGLKHSRGNLHEGIGMT